MANDKITAVDVLKEVAFVKACLDCSASKNAQEAAKQLDPRFRDLHTGFSSGMDLAAEWLGAVLDMFSSALEDA